MLVPVPGSQHTMGLFMVAQFFRHAGWDVWGDAALSEEEILAAARTRHFDLIGFSIGSETHVERLSSVILEVRKASRNEKLVVVVGGPIILADPGLVAQVGADGSGADAAEAVEQAESLVAQRAARG
jgi:methylmalonyl-CoA mutase cobalamin-binding domain/chain